MLLTSHAIYLCVAISFLFF